MQAAALRRIALPEADLAHRINDETLLFAACVAMLEV
jgi:hypothetical protein